MTLHGHWIVRLPTWLGDTVMAVGTIRALARSQPDGLTLWGPAPTGRLLQACGVGAGLLPYSRRPGTRGLADVRRAVRALGSLRPRGVLLLPNAFEPALIAALAGVRQRVGFATDGRGFLLTDPMTPSDPLSTRHDADRYADLLAAVRVQPPRAEDALLEAPREGLPTARRLVGRRAPLLGIVPGWSNGPAKQWPAESYARVAELAAREWGAWPVIVGTDRDREIADDLQRVSRVRCIDLVGKTTIVELAAVLSMCQAAVGNDTGATHLAAALGCPTLAVFGPTDPARTRPRGPHVGVASNDAFCQPCRAAICPLDHRCLRALAADLVFAKLQPLWRAGRGRTVS